MIAKIVGGVIRALFSALGGGLISDGDMNALIGALTLAVTIGWSVWTHIQERKK